MFQKAVKQESKLRLAISGVSGSGKTYTSLKIASETGGKVALIDTERGSASKYADIFNFDVMNMQPPYHPDRFVKAIHEASEGKYDVVVVDSLSHAWNGTGGLLELVDQFALKSRSQNTFTAWKEGTPIYNRMIDGILQSDIHVIATMRSKQEYVLEQDANGKMKPQKRGLAPVQRDGLEYEFDVVIEMDVENNAVVTKTRCPELTGKVFKKPGKDVSDILIAWLHGEAHTTSSVAQSRPYPPAVLKEKLAELSSKEYSQLLSENSRKILARQLTMLAGGDDSLRYQFCLWAFGKEHTKDLTEGQINAAFAWLGVKGKTFQELPRQEAIDEFGTAIKMLGEDGHETY